MTIKDKLEKARAEHRWLDHSIAAAERYTAQRGDFYAAGITYFTVLALFPLAMVAFAVAGYVLQSHPEMLADLQQSIRDNSGELADTINRIVDQAIGSRNTVGVIGLLGAAYAGLGWMSNLRQALSEQWAQEAAEPGLLRAKVGDLGALVGLGLALAVSIGISALGASSLGQRVLSLVGLEHSVAGTLVLRVLSVAVSILATWAVFVWVIARLPRASVALRSAAQAALLGAVAFELFKQLAAIYLAIVLKGPAGVTFGPILGLMVFAFISYRIILFATAWAATAPENQPSPEPEPIVVRPRYREASPVAVAAGAVAAGVVVGLAGAMVGRFFASRPGQSKGD